MPRCKVRKRRKYQECGGATCPHLLQSRKGIKRSEAPRWYIPASTIVLSGDDASVCAALQCFNFVGPCFGPARLLRRSRCGGAICPCLFLSSQHAVVRLINLFFATNRCPAADPRNRQDRCMRVRGIAVAYLPRSAIKSN